MSKITINAKSIKYLPTHNGVAFTADLLIGGNKAGTIENNGNGGDTHAYTLREAREQIEAESKLQGFDLVEYFLDHLMDVAEGVAK